MVIKQIDIVETAKRITDRIRENDISYREIALLLDISQQSVYKWEYCGRMERGIKSIPSIQNMVKLSSILGCTVDDLIVTYDVEIEDKNARY